jgi:ABC-type polysaccharide/polyol phosphate export permease
MTSTSSTRYDSSARRRPLVSEAVSLWRHRDLLRLLITRDVIVRYKRSVLGVAWTLLMPLMTMAVMWVVFSAIFRFKIPGVPFTVYLLSGIVLISFFTQGVLAAGSSIVNNSPILANVYVPPEIFAFSATGAAAVNLFISLIPLFAIQLITGVGIPWTVVLVPIPALALLAFATGVGLLVASAAVFFYDVLNLTEVLLQLVGYLTPTFYPISIITSPPLLNVIYANPLYSYLVVFRGFVYEGSFAPTWNFAYMIASALIVLPLGVWTFSRQWKRLVVLI